MKRKRIIVAVATGVLASLCIVVLWRSIVLRIGYSTHEVPAGYFLHKRATWLPGSEVVIPAQLCDACREDEHLRCAVTAFFYVDKARKPIMEPGEVEYPDWEKTPYTLSLDSNEIQDIELRVGTAEMAYCSCPDVYHTSASCYSCAHGHHESCSRIEDTRWGFLKDCKCECDWSKW